MQRVAVLALVASLSGCSVAMLRRPHLAANREIECSPSYGWAVLDAGLGLLSGGVQATLLVDPSGEVSGDTKTAMAATLVVPTLLVASAFWGFYQAKRCRILLEAQASERAEAAARQRVATPPPPMP